MYSATPIAVLLSCSILASHGRRIQTASGRHAHAEEPTILDADISSPPESHRSGSLLNSLQTASLSLISELVHAWMSPQPLRVNSRLAHARHGTSSSSQRVKASSASVKRFVDILQNVNEEGTLLVPGQEDVAPDDKEKEMTIAEKRAQILGLVQEVVEEVLQDPEPEDPERKAAQLMTTSGRVQRIKNILVNKQILGVLTACEFALRLETTETTATIDYPSLLKRIDKSLDILRLRYDDATSEDAVLMKRLNAAKRELEQCSEECDTASLQIMRDFDLDGEPLVPDQGNETVANETEAVSLSFLVREDGTVDWDEAIATSKEVARMGAELWERLNGREQEEGFPSFSELMGTKRVKEEELTEEVKRLKKVKKKAEIALNQMRERSQLKKTELWMSIEQGNNLTNSARAELKTIDEKTSELSKLFTLCELNLDIERICVYLEQDLQESGLDISDLKLVVAELNLIERQYLSILGGLKTEDLEEATKQSDLLKLNRVFYLVENEELELIKSNLEDLKTRLGIAGSAAAPIDWGSFGTTLQESGKKIGEGWAFYSGGSRMLASDVSYTLKLFSRAVGGYTLKPREVNSIRRLTKDLLTLVPFTIILIIPLSPVGHVLVFSFIQRVFPNFFPSMYTDRRQKLRELYNDVLTLDEEAILGPPPPRKWEIPGLRALKERFARKGKGKVEDQPEADDAQTGDK